MASSVMRRLCLVVAAGAVTLSAVPPAEASVTLGPCTVTALTPTPVAVAPNGKKLAYGRASARCTASREMQVQIARYGDDLFSDDHINDVYYSPTVGPTLQTVGSVRMCGTAGHPESFAPCTG